jgi:hypothetical protein
MLDQLLDMMAYKREVLTQLLLVATIFGAFSVSGVVALLVADRRNHLFHFFFLMLTFASLAFIFATALDAILLPGMKRTEAGYTADQVRGLMQLGDVVIWSVLVGTLALSIAIAGFGFVFGRTIGIIVLVMSTATVALFIASAIHLARVLG